MGLGLNSGPTGFLTPIRPNPLTEGLLALTMEMLALASKLAVWAAELLNAFTHHKGVEFSES